MNFISKFLSSWKSPAFASGLLAGLYVGKVVFTIFDPYRSFEVLGLTVEGEYAAMIGFASVGSALGLAILAFLAGYLRAWPFYIPIVVMLGYSFCINLFLYVDASGEATDLGGVIFSLAMFLASLFAIWVQFKDRPISLKHPDD